MNKYGQEVYLVRHGETEWSRSGQHTGSSDLPLTDEGDAVARQLGRKLHDRHYSAVLSSPLSRAVETARLAGFEHPEIDADLEEWNYGKYEGLTTPQIRETDPNWFLFRDGAPGGESPEQVGERADRVVERVRAIHGDVLLFAHGHILRVVAARWLGYPAGDGGHFSLGTATLSVLGYEHEAATIWQWNAA